MKQIVHPSRADALRRLGLLDTPAEEVFDRLSALAALILKTPISLLSLIDSHRVFIKSSSGLPEPWASAREAPLSFSFCKHVVGTTAPLVVEDSRLHPVFADHPATREFQVIAYLGIPLVLNDGFVLGSFCVVDTKPCVWTGPEIESLQVLARAAITEIELRDEIRREKAANEQLARANEDVKAFTYSIGHDLHSHLARLRSFTDILIEEDVQASERCRDYMRTIQRTVTQFSSLLEALLNLAKASTRELRVRMVDLSSLAEEIVVGLRHAQPERVVHFSADDGLMAQTDPALARLLLQNLLGNAWKFTAKRADARIEFTAVECDGIRRFEVRDNGVGFWPSQADQLFQPFKKLHNALEFSGTGLGLQGAKRIVERHGGTIQAEGSVGEGACFRFTLEPRATPRPAPRGR